MHRQTNIMYNIKLFSSKKKNHIHQRHNILRDRPFSFEGCDLLSSFLHVLPRKSYDTLSRTECKVKIIKYVEGNLIFSYVGSTMTKWEKNPTLCKLRQYIKIFPGKEKKGHLTGGV
jgi:hypothetical protein